MLVSHCLSTVGHILTNQRIPHLLDCTTRLTINPFLSPESIILNPFVSRFNRSARTVESVGFGLGMMMMMMIRDTTPRLDGEILANHRGWTYSCSWDPLIN